MKQYLISVRVQDGENDYVQHYVISASGMKQAEKIADRDNAEDKALGSVRDFGVLRVVQVSDEEYKTLSRLGII